MFITEKQYYRDDRSVDETCPGPCCTRYSRAYLHHLFRIGDALAQRLATIHNLTFMQRLMHAAISYMDCGDEDEPQS
ncbi:tRNA-guanine transglycosylase [Pseudomonas aeruginosa]|nr:tRNA-guanine transglycosylase [Pseudomonas aeruginosa]